MSEQRSKRHSLQSFTMEAFTMEEVLQAIGTHRLQVAIIILSALAYGHFSVQTMMSSLTTISMWADWEWLEQDRITYNLVFALGAFARLAGTLLLLPWIDVIGRRPFLFWCLVLSTTLAVASAAAPNFPIYVALRSAVLFTTAVLPSAATIYSLEMVFVRRRALPAMMCQTAGVLYVIFGTFLTGAFESSKGEAEAWRWSTGIVNAPTLIAIGVMALLWLETPRYQAANQEDPQKAWRTLCALCPKGEEGLLIRLKAAALPHEFKGISKQGREKSRWFELVLQNFKQMGAFVVSKSYRRTTFGLGIIWALQSFAHWGMSSYLTLFYTYIGINRTWATAGSFAIQLPGQVLIYWFMQRFGRRPAMCWAAAGAGVALLTLAFSLMGPVDGWSRSRGWLTAVSLLGYFFGSPIWGVIYAFSAESYPTLHRGAAMSVFGAITAISTVITTYVGTASLDEDRLWIFPMIWGVLRFGISLASYIPKEETVGRDLEDQCTE